VWLFRVAEWFGYDFQTILHFADIAMQWVMLQKSLLAFLLPARNMQSSLY